MGDRGSMISILGGEENLIASAKCIMRELDVNKSLTDEARKVLADLCFRLSTMNLTIEDKNEGVVEIENQLKLTQEKIMRREPDQSMIYDSGPAEVSEYVEAVDEFQSLIKSLESLSLNKGERENELLRKSVVVLQTAMSRLEEEFRYMLVQNKQPYEPGCVSFRSSEEECSLEEGSIVSFEEESFDDTVHRDSISRNSEEFIINLINPDVIPDLKSIADLMFVSNYNHECSQAFIGARKDALAECLFCLEWEKTSIEDVTKMEWKSLHSKIKRWVWVMKIFVRVYLTSEKRLTNQIFGECGSANSVCFSEASKGSMLQLLNFGEAVFIGPHRPEKLIVMLDMYEVLSDLIPDIENLFSKEASSAILSECKEVLRRLGDSVITTFLNFEIAIESNTSSKVSLGGVVHPLTKYVMNYLRTLTEYSETLNFLLRNYNGEKFTSLDFHFQSLVTSLESNLDERSNLYKDSSLQHLFLMNNFHYIAEKLKGPELRGYFGDDWIRKRNSKFQREALYYERATWSSILSLLSDDGIRKCGSNSVSKTILKERLRNFYSAFEEVYKSQTAWFVPDSRLREDLKISMSVKVIRAYTTFVGRYNSDLSDRYIKYSGNDLENYLLDLFEGSPRSL